MRRAGLILLLTTLAAVAEDDLRVLAFKRFFSENIKGKWASEELSEMRVVMVRDFDKHDVPEAARWLINEVISKEDAADVVREAVRVLSKFKSPFTIREMNTIFASKLKKSWEARALLLLAFGPIKFDEAERSVALGLKDKDPRVVVAACRAAAEGRRIALKDALIKLLKHKHRAVRGAAALALAELRADDAMPHIFPLFCNDVSHRVRYDAWRALKKLSLEKFPCDPAAWEKWWEQQVGALEEGQPNPWGRGFPRKAPESDKCGSFFGVPVLGDRVVFVLDTSTSFEQSWKIDHKEERKKPKSERIPNFFSVKTRWDLVKSYVGDCLKQLPETTEVAFVFFDDDLTPFPDNARFVRNKAKSRQKLLTAVDEAKRSGGSATFEAFKIAWGFIKDGHPDHNFNKGCDTILFVTDSFVKDGELKNRPDRLRDEIWRVAVPRNLVVHSIGLHNHDYSLGKGIAEDTKSLYVHAQQAGDTAEPQDLDFWPEKKKAFEAARKKKY